MKSSFILIRIDTNICLFLVEEKKEAIIWGPTGVEPWSASMITGIDWKSLTIPASLPTTFDVAPLEDELKRDYTFNSYELIHVLPPLHEYDRKRKHGHNGSGNQEKFIPDPMERQRLAFDELIDQRLSQVELITFNFNIVLFCLIGFSNDCGNSRSYS